MGQLGDTVATGKLSTQQLFIPGTLLWVCSFPVDNLPRDQDFEVYHGSAEGPGGVFKVYLDDKFYGAGRNGTINEYNPRSSAMYVRKGQAITVVWSIGTGNPPTVRFWMRTPEVGKL
jgi:hypothetical protein